MRKSSKEKMRMMVTDFRVGCGLDTRIQVFVHINYPYTSTFNVKVYPSHPTARRRGLPLKKILEHTAQLLVT